MTAPYRLHYAPDNASLIVRLALEELGQSYATVLVDRRRNAQRSGEYLALNPAGRIPTLETPDGPISETGAILLWLADRHGGIGPGPAGPGRAAFLNWLFFVANTLHPEVIQTFYIHRYGPEPAWPAMRAALRKRILGHVAMLEGLAATGVSPWLGGAAPSAIDLYIAAILRWVRLYPEGQAGWLHLDDYPALADMCARLETRASVRALRRAEGLGAHPFTAPEPPRPPEGSAT